MESPKGGTHRQPAYVVSHLPIDFSYKEIKDLSELEEEDPRFGVKKPDKRVEGERGDKTQSTAAESMSSTVLQSTMDTQKVLLQGPGNTTAALSQPAIKQAISAKQKLVVSIPTSVRLSNNEIQSLEILPQALLHVMPHPAARLLWLDVSFNKLRRIEDSLLQFPNLHTLYLHANKFTKLKEVDKLRELPGLKTLTLNGNPFEANPLYRTYVMGAVPGLKHLDHSPLTDLDLEWAEMWRAGFEKRERERRERAEELALQAEQMA
uniref:Leucine-rich repeat-containing protein 51 n=1 Tax=Chromera velia CCMP2878 TaxID=1169474 RepID=A0A0G4F412_9ALVE|eukprot:Cvel_14911.t1-p1 / transcript=Cvel_14911.t1 / gene=Cvel_14911 / organism=Chromera_velia_CCMP2878 / gene_product=Leucine-rich repeat-containing protein 51, putative / transcript_product=Leucine-rich repeat-containing protein 51, putative / location=Cvel_scaffold1080:38931-42200(-) / protein_length=263 / sequence_SO=supercontig / SO=protein_coding / is_pseudo=false